MKKTELDEAFADLFDPKESREARNKAEEIGQNWTSRDIDYLRKRAKNDLFFLCRGPLEYDKLSRHLHGDLIAWMQKRRNSQYKMILLPRGHYKSTVSTIGESVQIALPNDAGVEDHPFHLGPNVKVLLAHEVRETASKFLYEITAAFTRKPMLMALFPECIPARKIDRMNKWELELPRSQYHKEATFSTIGTGGAAQGGHYHKLKLDDLVGEKARDSEPTMATSVSWFDNINSLLTEFDIDGWDLIGTRWAYSDVYSRAMNMYGIALEESVTNCIPKRELEKYANGLLRVYARGAIEGGSPIFPEKFSLGRLATIQKNPIIWATQYANNPIASGLTEFNWPLQFYTVSPDMRTITYNDGEYINNIPVSMLDVYVLVDPSMGEDNIADPTGIMVVGIDPKFNLFVLETIKDRLLPPKFVDEIFRLQNKWRPKKFAIEEGNFAGIYKYWIQEKSASDEDASYHPTIQNEKQEQDCQGP